MPDPVFKPVAPAGSSNLPQPDPLGASAKPMEFTPVDPMGAGGGGSQYSRTVYGKDLDYSTDPGEYRFQLKTNADNNLLRAQDQGPLETLGIKLANMPVNIVAGIGEMVGYAGALFTERGTERDYSNNLTELMQSIKNPVGEIYRENPNQTFDLTDSAWWIDNIGSVAESAAQFALPAGVIGKGFGAIARLAAVGGRTALVGANAAAQTATAASLAYMEGAMSGYRVYQDTYEAQYRKGLQMGLDPTGADEHAKKRASDAAATTVQLNTLMNTALNLTALAPLFKRSEDEVMQFMRNRAAKRPGESGIDYKTRLLTEAEEAGVFTTRQGITSYGSEAAQEGLEEINTQYAEKEGQRVGQGKKKNVADALTQFGTAIQDVSDQEGALNFILGSFGGVAQTVALDRIPLHRVPVPGAKEGAKTKTFVSSRTRNADNTRRYFDSISDALAKDADWQEKKTVQLAAAIAKGDEVEAEIIRNDMFDVLGLNAVQLGLGEQWINTFKEIAETPNKVEQNDLKQQLDMINEQIAQSQSPEEQAALNQSKAELIQSFDKQTTPAMDKGLAMNMNDNAYKVRALQAIEDIKAYQRMHDQIYSKYSSEEEKHAGLPDYIYGNAANLYRQEKIHERETTRIEAAEAEDMLKFAGTATRTDEMVKYAMGQAKDTIKIHENIIKRIKEDQNEFNNAIAKNDPVVIEKLLAKHKVLGQMGTAQIKALGDRMGKQLENAARIIKETENKVMESSGFTQWKDIPKNADKTITDYLKLLGERYSANAAIRQTKEGLAILAKNIEENRERLKELTSTPENVRKTLAKMKQGVDARDKAAADAHQEAELARNLERTAAQAHVDQNTNVLQGQERMLHIKIRDINEQLVKSTEQLAKRNERVNNLKLTQHSMFNLKYQVKIQVALADAKALAREIAQLEAQRADLQAQLGVNLEVQAKQTVEAVTGAEDVMDTETEVTDVEQPEERVNVSGTLEEAFGEPPAGTTPVTAPVVETTTTVEPTTTLHEETAEPILIAANRYIAHLNRLPGELHPAFAKYEEDLKDGVPFDPQLFVSLDVVRDALEMGLAWKASVFNALNLLKAYVDLLPKKETPKEDKTQDKQEEDMDPQDKRTVEEKWDEATEKEKLSQPTVGMPDDPQTANGPDVVENRDKIHEGKKAENMLKLNFSSLEYENFTNKRGNWAMAGSVLNPKLPPQIVDPKSLPPGTVLTAALDKSFNDKVRVHGVPGEYKDATYDDYTDAAGNVTDVNDVPIKLMMEDGTVVGYLPTVSWMFERFPGTHARGEGFRNIVATIEGTNPDGTIYEIDNLSIQHKELTELRQLIVNTTQVNIAIKEKGPGTVIMNMVKTGETFKPMKGRALSKNKPENSMLPDKKLKIGTVLHGVVHTGKDEPFEGKINNNDLALYHNAPVIILPMADGSFSVSPLYMPDLDNDPSNNQAHATIERALWLYMKAGDTAVDAELDQAFQATGLNFRNAADLRRFINQQFTYMNKFDSHNTALNPNKSPKFLFNITNPVDGKATIMLGWENSGEPKIVANLTTSGAKIDPRFMAALKEGLASRTRNVNFTRQGIRGINSRGQFNEHYFTGKEWKTTVHENYNEYVKSYAMTYVNGRNQLGDMYVYGANPMITLDRSSAEVKLDPNVPINPVLIVEPTVDDTTKPDSAPISTDDYDELASSMGYDNYAAPIDSVPTSMRPSENMQLITLNLLQEIRTLTPPARLNGKTVQQVYEELLKSGVPYLDEGHNPFLNCT